MDSGIGVLEIADIKEIKREQGRVIQGSDSKWRDEFEEKVKGLRKSVRI